MTEQTKLEAVPEEQTTKAEPESSELKEAELDRVSGGFQWGVGRSISSPTGGSSTVEPVTPTTNLTNTLITG